jgi:ketosteroid isomerase-like protein
MPRKALYPALALVTLAVLAGTIYTFKTKRMKPDFDAALHAHFAAITNRDLAAFRSHLPLGDTLYTVVQNGHAFKTPAEITAIHEQWFKDPHWTWKGQVVHKVVGEDMAMALVRYTYQPNPETAPFETWLVYVFQLQEGSWRIIHDQNTALDFHAFARAAGLEK